MTYLNKEQKKRELIDLLKQKCYRKGDFLLSSGRRSEHYMNCKPVTLDGYGLELVSELMADLIDEDAVAVGGLTLGADPLVAGIAMKAKISGFIVRKEPKGHGTNAKLEGPKLPKGSKVTVVEDVTTTCKSAIKAVRAIREAGYDVTRIVTLIDRQEYGEADIYALDAKCELLSVFGLEELL